MYLSLKSPDAIEKQPEIISTVASFLKRDTETISEKPLARNSPSGSASVSPSLRQPNSQSSQFVRHSVSPSVSQFVSL